jgi:CHAT domain-containing protein
MIKDNRKYRRLSIKVFMGAMLFFMNLIVCATGLAPRTAIEQVIDRGDALFQQGHFREAAKQWETSLEEIDCRTHSLPCFDLFMRSAAAYQAVNMPGTMFLKLEQALCLKGEIKDMARRSQLSSQLSDAWLSVGYLGYSKFAQAEFEFGQDLTTVNWADKTDIEIQRLLVKRLKEKSANLCQSIIGYAMQAEAKVKPEKTQVDSTVDFNEPCLSAEHAQVVAEARQIIMPYYLENAFLLADESIKEAQESATPNRILARACNTQANVLATMPDQVYLAAAVNAYETSIDLAEQAGDSAFALKVALNLFKVLINLESLDQMASGLGEIWQRVATLPDTYAKANYSVVVGRQALDLLAENRLLLQAQEKAKMWLREEQEKRRCKYFRAGQCEEYLPNTFDDTSAQTFIVGKPPLTKTEKMMVKKLQQEPGLDEATQKVRRQAYLALTTAAQIAKSLQDVQTQSIAYGYLGELYQQAADYCAKGKHCEPHTTNQYYAAALTFTRRAIFFANQNHIPVAFDEHAHLLSDKKIFSEKEKLKENAIPLSTQFSHYLYRWYWQLGQILKQQGNTDEALKAYRLASQNLKPIQQHLDLGYRRPLDLFDKVVKPIHYGRADLLLQVAKRTDDIKKQQALLREAVETVDLIKVAELKNYFDECVLALHAKTRSLLDQNRPKTAILYPIPLPDRLVVVVVIDKIYQEVVDTTTADEVNQMAQELRSALQTRSHNKFLLYAEKLYRWLIQPIESKLQYHGVETLVVVPDGKLRTIPFSVFYDGQQFLVEKYALALTPGLKLVDPQPMRLKNGTILLGGVSEGVLNHSPLKNVPKELKMIEKITKKVVASKKILNADYSVANFYQQVNENQYSIIHLATHGEFNPDPAHTYLLAYDDFISMDDLQAIIGLGRFRDKPLELLTLSACKTAAGDDRAALGLAGVGIKAGARSAIATLWYVDDKAASMIMSNFYQFLTKSGVSKAKALQKSQQALIHKSKKRYWHPMYWAPFLLIGNWL